MLQVVQTIINNSSNCTAECCYNTNYYKLWLAVIGGNNTHRLFGAQKELLKFYCEDLILSNIKMEVNNISLVYRLLFHPLTQFM